MTTDQRIRAADAKTHTVVEALIGDQWEARYLYRDADGWYIWNDAVRFRVECSDGEYLDGVRTP